MANIVSIQMFGLERVQKMCLILPKNTEKEIDKTDGEFISFVQKSAKLRAPRFSGQLVDSINKKKTSKYSWELTVESPYGWFQEQGFRGVFLPAGMPVQGGYRIGDWMEAKGISGFGFRPSGIAHPFVGPAFESGLNHLPNMLQNAVFKAAKESAK
jgi:hypothetical protein